MISNDIRYFSLRRIIFNLFPNKYSNLSLSKNIINLLSVSSDKLYEKILHVQIEVHEPHQYRERHQNCLFHFPIISLFILIIL